MKTLLAFIALSFASLAFADGTTPPVPAASATQTTLHKALVKYNRLHTGHKVCHPQLTTRCYIEK